jgi:hypothetical protein
MAGTPQPIVADVVQPLGLHLLQTATDARLGGQGHGRPPLVLGVLVAEAHLPLRDGEEAVVGQRDPVDLAARVGPDWLRALHGRLTVDDPPFGPDVLGKGQVRSSLTYQIEKPPAKELREGVDGHHVGRAGGPPRGPVGGDPTGRHQAVDVRMVGQGTGPGVQDTQAPHQAADIMRVRSRCPGAWSPCGAVARRSPPPGCQRPRPGSPACATRGDARRAAGRTPAGPGPPSPSPVAHRDPRGGCAWASGRRSARPPAHRRARPPSRHRRAPPRRPREAHASRTRGGRTAGEAAPHGPPVADPDRVEGGDVSAPGGRRWPQPWGTGAPVGGGASVGREAMAAGVWTVACGPLTRGRRLAAAEGRLRRRR